jgi:hypothetical protein
MNKVEIYNWRKDGISRDWFSDNLFGRSNRELGIGMRCGDLFTYDNNGKYISDRDCYILRIAVLDMIQLRIQTGVIISKLIKNQKLGILKALADE